MATALVTQIAYAVQTLFDPAGTAGRLVDLGKLANYGLLTNFTPGYLFTAGVNGAWYDPSDFSTMFQDAAGTTPVTAVGQPVGLMLDKSKGLVLGSELVTNGDFGNGTTRWSESGTGEWDISGGKAYCTAGTGDGKLTQTSAFSTNKWFQISFDLEYTSGLLQVQNDGYFNIVQFPSGSTSGKKTAIFPSGNGSTLSFRQVGFVGSIDNISVRELPGNHAFNPSGNSANFPVLSARYNLLTNTEDFSDAVWIIRRATVTTNNATAPNGTVTACTMTATSNFGSVLQSFTSVVGVNYTPAIYIKRRTGTGAVAMWNAAGTIVDITASVGSDWTRVTVPAAAATATTAYFYLRLAVSGDAVDIWGADLRVSNDALNQPAYQRVNTASDYDTVGFKPYLAFNGTDQWLQTNSIDFTYGDKMFVSAGVRKLSDAATGILAELSTGSNVNNGSFHLVAPATVTTSDIAFFSRGTIRTSALASGYSAPITGVLSGIGNISGDQAILRVNGTQAAIDATDQGTGNYGNYPLYIGARAGSSIWFNGRLYGLVVAGKAASASEIASTEAYLNQKTGAY